jgi:hypothetical protein
VAAGLYRGQRLDVRVRAPREVEGPVDRGATLGRAMVLVDGRAAGSTPLLAARAIPSAGAFDRVRSFVSENAILTAMALFVILIVTALVLRLVRRRARGEQLSGGIE